MAMSHLERRKIEAGVLVPMLQAFQRAFGREAANAVAREVIVALARQDGARWAKDHGDNLAGLAEVSQIWAAGGGLEVEQVPSDADHLHFNVVRCGYAEHLKNLGVPELGYLFHCSRDFAMAEGFSDKITLERKQTIMEGASHCDFRFGRRE
jgi:hypothetical protein